MYPKDLSSKNRKQQSLFIKLLFACKKMKTLTTIWWANFYYIYFVHLHDVYIHRTLKKDEQFKIFKFNWHAAIYLLNSYSTLYYCSLPTWGQTTGNENLEKSTFPFTTIIPCLLPPASQSSFSLIRKNMLKTQAWTILIGSTLFPC
jgi:hypothetical protein